MNDDPYTPKEQALIKALIDHNKIIPDLRHCLRDPEIPESYKFVSFDEGINHATGQYYVELFFSRSDEKRLSETRWYDQIVELLNLEKDAIKDFADTYLLRGKTCAIDYLDFYLRTTGNRKAEAPKDEAQK